MLIPGSMTALLSDGDAVKEDVHTRRNDGSLSDGDAAKEDVATGKSGSLNNDNNGEVHEQENGEESAEKDKEDINPLSSKVISENEELCKTVQEEEDKQEHAKSADDTRDTYIIRLGSNSSKGKKLLLRIKRSMLKILSTLGTMILLAFERI